MKQAAARPTIQFSKPSPILEWVGRTLAKLLGWTIDYQLPDDPKMVLVFFPHTSNMDVVVGITAAFALGLKPSWLLKNEIARPPFRNFFIKLGAIPIDRHKRESKVEIIAEAIENSDRVMLALSPEGTRSKTDYWRSGFYHIARLADVPVHFAFIDYPSKTVGAKPGFVPTGNIEADLEKIRKFYADKRGKYPERVGPIRFRS